MAGPKVSIIKRYTTFKMERKASDGNNSNSQRQQFHLCSQAPACADCKPEKVQLVFVHRSEGGSDCRKPTARDSYPVCLVSGCSGRKVIPVW